MLLTCTVPTTSHGNSNKTDMCHVSNRNIYKTVNVLFIVNSIVRNAISSHQEIIDTHGNINIGSCSEHETGQRQCFLMFP